MHFRALRAGVVALGVLLATPAAALSAISPTTTIDGPNANILELGGVTMAEDGTGGLVYLKRDGSRAHVFAARFVNGAWTPPQRVDRPGPYGTQAFDSSWPRIGAGEGGRLVVTWVQEFGAGSDRMFSASLDPGATRFQDPVPLDLNVGEATATFPSLEMNAGGQAYLSYRIVNRGGALPPDFVNSDTRIARYNGAVWTVLGSLADRNPTVPTRTPSDLNSPEVGIDSAGNGMVAFQEPDDDFIDRIWARRLFGTSQGVVRLVSPQLYGPGCFTIDPAKPEEPPRPADPRPAECKPLRAPADQFSLDMPDLAVPGAAAGLGLAAVAFRQQSDPNSGLTGTRIFANTAPDASDLQSASFRLARLADGQPLAPPGPAGVAAAPGGRFLTAFGRGNATFGGEGDDATLASDPAAELPPPLQLDDSTSAVAPEPVAEVADSGAAVVAWKAEVGGRGSVTLIARPAEGAAQFGTASAPSGGPVVQLASAGSGLGDAVVAFRQGGQSFPQIAASVVDVAPEPFILATPFEFQRGETVPISWDRPPDAFGGLTYAVQVDGEVVFKDLTERSAVLGPEQVADGVHEIKVVATDGAGQAAESFTAEVQIDRTAPRARARTTRRRTVEVVVSDGPRGRVSGAVPAATDISFGDGRRARRATTASHRYRRPGRYRIKVRTRDAAGNRTTRSLKVRVR